MNNSTTATQKLTTNTLVTHNKKTTLGIGCIVKVLAKNVKVIFGDRYIISCTPRQLTEVDTSKCSTMTFDAFKSRSIGNTWEGGNNIVIIGNEVRQYVGIGWVTLRVVTGKDLLKYPRIIH